MLYGWLRVVILDISSIVSFLVIVETDRQVGRQTGIEDNRQADMAETGRQTDRQEVKETEKETH